ncbi:unnamed protein product [Paramecium primaurelia]|uniref:Uncharacterized protein n=1 Tax=Paramecium primaurelia TaxID=5886 RepID=A0A8S1NPQ5_PARPR|nr:unnamed protein product [Paramecium primaurelia]
MKYFILTLFVLNAYSFSLNDDWDGMEEAIKVQQDAILVQRIIKQDLVDQLDVYSDTPITQQIENQVQQLMNPSVDTDKQETEDEQTEVHSLEYWLERLGDEYSDETILLQQSQQITTDVDNIKIEDINLISESSVIINNIDLEYQDQNMNENIQMEQQLLNSAIQLQESLNQEDQQQQQNESYQNTLEVQINTINDESISKFIPNQDNNRMVKFLNNIQEDTQNYMQQQQQIKEIYNFQDYSFNKQIGEQRSIYNDKEDSTLQVVERDQHKEINKNLQQQYQINQKEAELNQNQQEEMSTLKKYLLYTDQPEVISTGTTEKEIEEDKRLINAFKSMNRNENWEIINKNQKINSDVRNEQLRFSNINEQQKQKQTQFQEVNENQVENPHQFISFKSDSKFEQVDNSKIEENVKSKYDELPETQLQSKEDMKREKEQKIQEMQKIIEEQLKNKTLKKKSETNKSLLYESEYLQWERITQTKPYPEINFVMTQNNLRKRL